VAAMLQSLKRHNADNVSFFVENKGNGAFSIHFCTDPERHGPVEIKHHQVKSHKDDWEDHVLYGNEISLETETNVLATRVKNIESVIGKTQLSFRDKVAINNILLTNDESEISTARYNKNEIVLGIKFDIMPKSHILCLMACDANIADIKFIDGKCSVYIKREDFVKVENARKKDDVPRVGKHHGVTKAKHGIKN